MINSTLILFIKIKTEIALILQGVSINTHYVKITNKQKILYTSLILSHHHSHIHTSFLSLFQKKKHIEGGRKKNILYSSSLFLITTHTPLLLSQLKKIEKEKRKKERR